MPTLRDEHRGGGVMTQTSYRAEDGFNAPTVDDRLDALVVAEAKKRGFAVAVRCSRCRQWVVAAESVAAHMGPVCRAKAAADV
jgi:hypothetical protein